MLGGVDGSHIAVVLSISIPWGGDKVDRSMESSGVLGAGLEAFNEGDDDNDGCEKTGGNCPENTSTFLDSS